MGRSQSKSVWVDVEVDLDDFDTDELIAELESRGRTVSSDDNLNDLGSISNCDDLVRELWQAFYVGNDARAMELARRLAEAATGRLVPQPLRRVA